MPLTYRGAPLADADHALVGTMEHGALGPRWAYDGCHDPVLHAQLLALTEGGVQARRILRPTVPDTAPQGATGHVIGAWQSPDGTRARAVFAALYPATHAL